MSVANKMIGLFSEYREYLGLAAYLDQQCEFEEAFCQLICEHDGHDIGPDQCGKPEHDYCYTCRKLRTEIEKETQTCDS